MTTTQLSLDHPTEIIDEYVQRSFHSIFLRPISPYGFAVRTHRKTGYEMESFLSFFHKGLEHILGNKSAGIPPGRGVHQNTTHKDLDGRLERALLIFSRPPVRAGMYWSTTTTAMYTPPMNRGMLAEMKDYTFRIGNVHKHSRKDILTSAEFLELQEASCNQTLPGCSDCAFQTYCGSDPIFNHATQGDRFGFRPTSAFCQRNMTVIESRFDIISQNDPETMRIFWSWLTDRNAVDMAQETP